MSKPKPCCATVFPWLQANLGKRCIAPLTGTDAKALAAAVHIIELYSYGRSHSLLSAFAAVVREMQPKCYPFAFHAIAHLMDWSDRSKIWAAAGLPVFIDSGIVPETCAFEPGGSGRAGKC